MEGISKLIQRLIRPGNARTWISRLVFVLTCTAGIGGVQAGTITISPGSDYLQISSGGSDGGTFLADATNLKSFTVTIRNQGGGSFSGIVLGTDVLGAPTGIPIWLSGAKPIPGSPATTGSAATIETFLFEPGISLTVGNKYFVGVDTGLFTGASGTLGLFNSPVSLYLDGELWRRESNLVSWVSFSSNDLVTTIVMDDTKAPLSEPGALAIFGFGLAGLAILRRRRRSA